jgi:hypothetical protein
MHEKSPGQSPHLRSDRRRSEAEPPAPSCVAASKRRKKGFSKVFTALEATLTIFFAA